jgi:hypothetical protein
MAAKRHKEAQRAQEGKEFLATDGHGLTQMGNELRFEI